MEDDQKKEKLSESKNKIIVAVLAFAGVVIAAIIAGIVSVYIQKSQEHHEEKMLEKENSYEQEFTAEIEVQKRTGIEYIVYKLKTNPTVEGYHVRAFPVIEYENGTDKKYIPVIGQFTQDEYVANTNGECLLFRENTSEKLISEIKEKFKVDVKAEYLIAIQYAWEGRDKKEVYYLKDGELTVAKPEMIIEVLEAWEADEKGEPNIKIDMSKWPNIDEEELETIFKVH